MKAFFDTSVLVAAFWKHHIHHIPSFKLFASGTKDTSCCALHSLAEVYSVMTRFPARPPIPPEHVVLFIDEIRARFTTVALTSEDYFLTLKDAASRGLTGGRIYDALLLRCAENSKAQLIYTWNLAHFQTTVPKLASRIRTP